MPRSHAIILDPAFSQPYVDAIWSGDQLLLSGRIGLTESGKLIEGDVVEQTTQAFANIARVLEAARLTLDDVVKATVFLTSMENYAAMNAAYVNSFQSPLPVRSCVAVVGLPMGALVEIEVVAHRRMT